MVRLSKSAKKLLARTIRTIRRADNGDRGNFIFYNNQRLFTQIPYQNGFFHALYKQAMRKGRKGPVYVLEKGVGKCLAEDLKNFARRDLDPKSRPVHLTTISVGNNYTKTMKEHIDSPLIGVGLRQRYNRKFHLIFDAYDEDYHLPKQIVAHSMRKTILDLASGGEYFTILPVAYMPGGTQFTREESKQLLRNLRARFPKIKIETREVAQRFEHMEYIDLVVHITKP